MQEQQLTSWLPWCKMMRSTTFEMQQVSSQALSESTVFRSRREAGQAVFKAVCKVHALLVELEPS